MSILKTAIFPIKTVVTGRYLLKELVRRDIEERFVGSFLGLLWSLVNPLVSICVYLFIFSMVLRIEVRAEEVGTNSFPIYFLSGFLPWLVFSEGINRSTGTIIENSEIIKKVVFPIELLTIEKILSSAIVNLVGFTIFFIYLMDTVSFNINWLAIFILLPLFLIFIWGISCFLSALCVFVRDVTELLPLVMMILFYATPIVYPISMVPAGILRDLISFNPITIFLSAFREVLFTSHIDWLSIGYAAFVSFLTYLLGSIFFMKSKPAFGDIL